MTHRMALDGNMPGKLLKIHNAAAALLAATRLDTINDLLFHSTTLTDSHNGQHQLRDRASA